MLLAAETVTDEQPSSKQEVLVYSTDATTYHEVCNALEPEGIDARHYTALDHLLRASESHGDAILLRIAPEDDVVDFMARIRSRTRLPLVVLSAPGAHHLAVDLMELGASDYLCRDLDGSDPVAARELRARLGAALRDAAVANASPRSVIIGEVTVDLARHKVMRGNAPVVLTALERKLLEVLVENLDEVVSHERLLREAWSDDHRHHTEYLRTYMSRLRRKLGWEGDRRLGPHIRAVRGVGYGLFLSGEDRVPTLQTE